MSAQSSRIPLSKCRPKEEGANVRTRTHALHSLLNHYYNTSNKLIIKYTIKYITVDCSDHFYANAKLPNTILA